MSNLQRRLGHRFSSSELLLTALTHRSYANERDIPNNERLEFLGDSVLQLVVTRHLFKQYPHLREGQMTRVRAAVVRKESLALVAEELELGEALRLGKGETQSGGRGKESILADAMEAVIGAVYQDGGWKAAEQLVMAHWREMIALKAAAPDARDAKTQLQELLAAEGKTPEYRRKEEGPGHARRFWVEVWVEGKRCGIGKGSARRLAEQQAAKQAMEALYSDMALPHLQVTPPVSEPPAADTTRGTSPWWHRRKSRRKS